MSICIIHVSPERIARILFSDSPKLLEEPIGEFYALPDLIWQGIWLIKANDNGILIDARPAQVSDIQRFCPNWLVSRIGATVDEIETQNMLLDYSNAFGQNKDNQYLERLQVLSIENDTVTLGVPRAGVSKEEQLYRQLLALRDRIDRQNKISNPTDLWTDIRERISAMPQPSPAQMLENAIALAERLAFQKVRPDGY